MVDYKVVAGIFNDFMALYVGREKFRYGIEQLYQKYPDNTLFQALMANMNEAHKLRVPEVLRNVYELFKPYRGRMLSDMEWEKIVNDTGKMNKMYGNNVWCRQILLELMNLLEQDDKELRNREKKAA